MSVTHSFIVPDYYTRFVCKGKDCRATCCNGWHITLSLSEYYRLLGLQCTNRLRQRLDSAFHIEENPFEERYAEITPRYDGDCPLRRPDGLCALQKECGEGVLSAVCRYYPRSPKTCFTYECSCSNSCEGVLELMFGQESPLTFQEKELTFDLPELETERDHRIIRYYIDIRRAAINIVQDRRFPLPARLENLCRLMEALYACYAEKRIDDVPNAISGFAASPSDAVPDYAYVMGVQRMLASQFEDISDSIRSYAAEALAFFDGKDAAAYRNAALRFEAACPAHARYFEHVLVNHIFYECFPFSDLTNNVWDETMALCAVYALMRFLALGCPDQPFVDMTAATFRLIDHTRFPRNAAILLHDCHCDTPAALMRLVQA